MRHRRSTLSTQLIELQTVPWTQRIETLTRASAGPLVLYVMGRIVDYETSFYAEAVAWSVATFPNSIVIPARGLWSSSLDWLSGWPSFSLDMDLGVIVTGPGRVIGRGVWTEVQDLTALGTPIVWVHRDDGEMRPEVSPSLRRLPGDDWNVWATVEQSSPNPPEAAP
jgi:hypothetical protein